MLFQLLASLGTLIQHLSPSFLLTYLRQLSLELVFSYYTFHHQPNKATKNSIMDMKQYLTDTFKFNDMVNKQVLEKNKNTPR